MSRNEPNFIERQKTSSAAKHTQLTKSRALAQSHAAGFAERQVERLQKTNAREKKQMEAAERKRADLIQAAQEKVLAKLVEQREKEAREAATEAKRSQEVADSLLLAAKQKANRDAKYAARQSRRAIRGGVR